MSYANANPRATGRKSSPPTTFSTPYPAAATPPSAAGPALDPRLVRFFEQLCADNFFGKVVLSFQNGKVVDVRTEQTRKLDEL